MVLTRRFLTSLYPPVLIVYLGSGYIEVTTGKGDKAHGEATTTQHPSEPRLNLTVELYLVVDFAAFTLWSGMAESLNDASIWSTDVNITARLVEFYTLHVKGVNERFYAVDDDDFCLNVTLTGIYVAKTVTQQPWVSFNVPDNDVKVNASTEAFVKWVNERNTYKNSSADHFIWITGYDLGADKTLGYNDSMCTNKSISVVQEDLDFIVQTRLAHRIGRSLGLTLDNEGNDCDDDGFVMNPKIKPQNKNGYHLWEFSKCSEDELEDFAEGPDSSCLFGRNVGNSLTLPSNYTWPGVIISVDMQCEFVLGKGFYLCRELYDDHYSDVCYGIWCCNGLGTEHKIIPMEGTPCYSYKYCLNGACVQAPRGQGTINPGTCLFGDNPFAYDSKHYGYISCNSVAERKAKFCYDRKFRSACCLSCEKAMSNITGCEFGDREDCNNIDPWECYDPQVRDECCATCLDHRHDIPGCEYGDRVATCDTLQGSYCYMKTHLESCCLFCHDLETGIENCRYGDRIPDCKEDKCETYSFQKQHVSCCQTCHPAMPTSTFTQSTTTWTTGTTMSTGLSYSGTTNPVVLSSSPSSKSKNTGVAIGASVGAVLLVVIIIAIIIYWRKRRSSEPKHLSPITDVMYNEYKLSKRAPVPEPRDIPRSKTGSKQKLMWQDSDVYAYINPDDVESIPTKIDPDSNKQNGLKKQGRNEDDPLPPTPGGYLELRVVDKYGYMEPVEKNKNKPNPYSEPYSDNKTIPYSNTGEAPDYKCKFAKT